MKDDASEEEMCDAVKELKMAHDKLKGEHEEVKGKLVAIGEEAKKAHKTKIDAMVNSAVEKGLIEKSEIVSITNLANTDFNTTKLMLDKLAPKISNKEVRKAPSMFDYIVNAGKEVVNTANFTYMDYSKKAPALLKEMQENNPTLYNQLLDAYKAEPKRWK